MPGYYLDEVDFIIGKKALLPSIDIDISVKELQQFVDSHRWDFSEFLRYIAAIEPFQDGLFIAYRPRSISKDIKATAGITLHRGGLVALDSQTDPLMDKDKHIHAGWLTYEIQRHLQLTKALLGGHAVTGIRFVLQFELSSGFQLMFSTEFGGSSFYTAQYTGDHHLIERNISLADIYDHAGSKRNIVMPVVQNIMDEIGRIIWAF